jgi:hypothetical protein
MNVREYLDIIHIAERLKDTMRHCTTSQGRMESVAEHSWRTALMALMYEKGFYGDGVLFIPLPHHAGTSDCLEIKIDEFDEWFDKSCEGYKRTRTGKRISRIHWRLDE